MMIGGVCIALLALPMMRRTASNLAYAVTDRRVLIVKIDLVGRVVSGSFPVGKLKPKNRPYGAGEGGSIELNDYVPVDDEDTDLLSLTALRDVREAAIEHLIQSSSKSSL